MHSKGKIPREEGFLRGAVFSRKRGSESFGASVLNEFEFLTMHHFKKLQWEDNGSPMGG